MKRETLKRPKRWDKPYDEGMRQAHVEWIMSTPHFQLMDETNFPKTLPLKGIVRNDCRVRVFEKDQLIVHAGAYTNSAFLILSGEAILVLSPGIASTAWGHKEKSTKSKASITSSLIRFFSRHKVAEFRSQIGPHKSEQKLASSSSVTKLGKRSVLPTVPDLDEKIAEANAESMRLKAGDIFGESAVLGRTMMNNTVVAKRRVEVLEIRWQGLRDICKFETEFKRQVGNLYRQRGLYEELLNQPLFAHVGKHEIAELAKHALFEVHGTFEWHKGFQKAAEQVRSDADINRMIQAEPLIAKEGDYPDGLLLVRNGFGRVSRKINHGHYTLGHLSAGDFFGLQELHKSWRTGEAITLACSLRALGYTDVIRIPSAWLERNVFSVVDSEDVIRTLDQSLSLEKTHQPPGLPEQQIDRKLTEFLVENRVINGTQTMMIDLERCVRCDDCVTACSNAHDNNPRFVRHGASFGKYMIANACMHCDDPVCMIGCPTGAIHRSDDGVVTINDETCIGCSTCANSCPYDNIRMVPISDERGQPFTDEHQKPILKATKCDLCSDVSGGPACERACSHDALTRIDVKDIDSLAKWVNR